MRLPDIVMAAVLLLCCCCSGDPAVRASLDTAERVMEDRPDSALAVLDAIAEDDISRSDDRALYHLLYTQALSKNGYACVNDSLIRLSAEYFRDRHQWNYMKSLFYLADIEHTNGQFQSSMNHLLIAKDIATGFGDSYWKAKITELIGDIFSSTYNEAEAAGCALAAAIDYEKAGKTDNHRYALVDYATALSNSGDHRHAIHLIDSIQGLANKTPADSGLIAYCIRAKFPALFMADRYAEAIALCDSISPDDADWIMTPQFLAMLVKAKLITGDSASAYDILSQFSETNVNPSERAAIMSAWVDYYTHNQEYMRAKALSDSIISLQNHIMLDVMSESALSAQRNHYFVKAQSESEKASRTALILILSITFALILIVSLIIIHRLRLNAKNAQIEANVHNILLLTEELINRSRNNEVLRNTVAKSEQDQVCLRAIIQQHESEIADNRQSLSAKDGIIESLFIDSWRLINMLCKQYSEDTDSEVSRKSLYSEIETEINKLREPRSINAIETNVNLYMENIAEKLRQQCGFLSDDDATILVLFIAGLSPRAISILRGIKLQNLYKRKQRLIERISSSDAEDRLLFISKLSK